MLDIMIDLETLSTRHDAAILSIGACSFEIETGEIGETFYTTIDYKTFNDVGHISIETVLWWMKQNGAARAAIDPGNSASLPPTTALLALNAFILNRQQSPKIWSNGSSFDLVILRNAFNRYSVKDGWTYSQERDVRTIVDLCRRIAGVDPKEGIIAEHHALSDAVCQAKYVSKAFQLIKRF